jgi:hypothetical protein
MTPRLVWVFLGCFACGGGRPTAQVSLPTALPAAPPTSEGSLPQDAPWRSDERFRVGVEVAGVPVKVLEHRVEVGRRPFTLVFELAGVTSIEVNASAHRRTLDRAAAHATLDNAFGPGRGGAEVAADPPRDIFVDDETFNFWGWDKDIQRCHVHEVRRGHTICKRIIESLMARQPDETVAETTLGTLYLVMLATDDEDRELQRDWLTVIIR